MTEEPRKPRPHSRADWKRLRPVHHGNSRPAPLLPNPMPGGGRKGTPDDAFTDR